MEAQCQPTVVCLGFFDGVHRGHQALIEAGRKAAREEGLLLCVHTFDHTPGMKDGELTSLEERTRLLKAAGAETVAVSVFDDALRQLPGSRFFREIVLGKLHARHVICGDDHRFGYKGACGVKELEGMCREAGVKLTVVPPVSLPGGRRISSSAVKKALTEGDFALAESMLGRPVTEEMKKTFHPL